MTQSSIIFLKQIYILVFFSTHYQDVCSRCKKLTDCAAEEIKCSPILLLYLPLSLGLVACAVMGECYCIRFMGRMTLP